MYVETKAFTLTDEQRMILDQMAVLEKKLQKTFRNQTPRDTSWLLINREVEKRQSRKKISVA